MAGLDDDHHAAATDWLSMDPDIGLAAAADVSILPRDEAWTGRSDDGHGLHDSRGGLIHGFTFAPTEREARDDLSSVTVGPRAGSGLVTDQHAGGVATHVMRIPVHLVCGVDPGAVSAGRSSVPTSREHIASFRTMSPTAVVWKERGLIPLAGSFRMVSNVWSARTCDVTFGLAAPPSSWRSGGQGVGKSGPQSADARGSMLIPPPRRARPETGTARLRRSHSASLAPPWPSPARRCRTLTSRSASRVLPICGRGVRSAIGRALPSRCRPRLTLWGRATERREGARWRR